MGKTMLLKNAQFLKADFTKEQKKELHIEGVTSVGDKDYFNFETLKVKEVLVKGEFGESTVKLYQLLKGTTVVGFKVFNGFDSDESEIFYFVQVNLNGITNDANDKVFVDLADAVNYYNTIANFLKS